MTNTQSHAKRELDILIETTPDVNGDWWTHSIKDEAQLKEAFEYYDKLLS